MGQLPPSITIASGRCPHGAPAGGCPICNGGGGGGGSVRKGEMSWGECYSMGQAMQAAKQRAELNNVYFQMSQSRAADQKMMQNNLNPFTAVSANVAQNRFLAPVLNFANAIREPIQKMANAIANTFNNLANHIRENVKKFTENFSENMQKLLSSVLNQKEAIQKTITEAFNVVKKKFLDIVTGADGKMKKDKKGKNKENQQKKPQEDEEDSDVV